MINRISAGKIEDEAVEKEFDNFSRYAADENQVQQKVKFFSKGITKNDIQAAGEFNIDRVNKRIVIKIDNKLYYTDLTEL